MRQLQKYKTSMKTSRRKTNQHQSDREEDQEVVEVKLIDDDSPNSTSSEDESFIQYMTDL